MNVRLPSNKLVLPLLAWFCACSTDRDGDRVSDQREEEIGTDPLNKDTDGDGIEDGLELSMGLNPLEPDTDRDGLRDGTEFDLGLDPLSPDTDGDGLYDRAEIALRTNPKSADTDRDGIDDGDEVDGNTDPTLPDTDGDGLEDGEEQIVGTDPTVWDTDQDGLRDGDERLYGTSPLELDTDGDGFGDGNEILRGSDPLDAWDWDFDGGDWPNRLEVTPTQSQTGWDLGDVIGDVELIDLVGRSVALHQFFGYVVRLDLVFADQDAGAALSAHARIDWEDHRDSGYIVLQIVQPPSGTPPGSLMWLADWARGHRLTFPVLDGGSAPVFDRFLESGLANSTRPLTVLLDRQLRIHSSWLDLPPEDFEEARDTLLLLPAPPDGP